MNVSFGEINGDQWEEWCQKILRLKYDNYQEVPAHFGGDLGVEGFTMSGTVFQCYCPDEDLNGIDLYEHQRDKITKDIKKLVKNAIKISQLGAGTIKEWSFLTPRYNNRELLAHCRKKEQEVRNAALSVIDDSFVIILRMEDDYIPEREALIGNGYLKIQQSWAAFDEDTVSDYVGTNNPIVGNIRDKLSKLPIPAENHRNLVSHISRDYLIGQQELETIYQCYPETYKGISQLKDAKEAQLQVESLMTSLSPGELLKTTLSSYETDLRSNYSNKLDPALIKRLSSEAIADWLGRCPLDFPKDDGESND